MCICCEITEKLKTSVMEEGVQEYITKRVELMAALIMTFSDVIEELAVGGKVRLCDIDDLRFSAAAVLSTKDGSASIIEDILEFTAEQHPASNPIIKH